MSKLDGGHGYKPKQLMIPMDLYQIILQWCVAERDSNTSRMMLKMIRRCATELSPEVPGALPEIAPPLFPDDEGDRDQPEIVRLRKIFPNDEPEVQKQLKEIEQGLKDAGIAEEDIRLTLYGSEGKDE